MLRVNVCEGYAAKYNSLWVMLPDYWKKDKTDGVVKLK